MTGRIFTLQQRLKEYRIDSFFISNQYNVSYLTGFTGLAPNEREGFLFVTKTHAYLLTFPTYFGLFQDGEADFETRCITATKRLTHHLAEIIESENLKMIGYEPENLTVSELESLESKLKVKLTKTARLVESLRLIKDSMELKSIKRAAEITDSAFEFIKTKLKSGTTERSLAFELEFFLKKYAGDIAFPPIVAFGKNAAIPHYLPDNRESRLSGIHDAVNYSPPAGGSYTASGHITNNNLILLDFGAKVDGYCADMTRVLFFGNPKDEIKRIYQTVLEAQEKALTAIKPGAITASIDKVTREYIIKNGYPEYPHGLGHGVGLAIHEAPRLKSDSTEILQEGMVVTVEPGIYLPGNCGVRIEDLVVLNNTGCEVLSKSSKEITVL